MNELRAVALSGPGLLLGRQAPDGFLHHRGDKQAIKLSRLKDDYLSRLGL